MDSILTSVKKMLGISEEYTHFDSDLIMHINAAFTVLCQLGVGPSDGFSIHDANDVWSSFISDGLVQNLVKPYMFLKVKFLFDPPLGSAVSEAMKRQIDEFEWRLQVLEGDENQNDV